MFFVMFGDAAKNNDCIFCKDKYIMSDIVLQPEQEQEEKLYLRDVSDRGKDRKWAERKAHALSLADTYYETWISDMIHAGYSRDEAESLAGVDWYGWDNYRRSQRVDGCAEVLEFRVAQSGRLKLDRAWFCHDRLCPMCNWRRSLKHTAQIAQLLTVIRERGIKGVWLMGTFTLRNVAGSEIGESFSRYALAYRRMMDYKAVKAYCLGAIRASEVTYNAEADSWNTHIHTLMFMRTNYFKSGYLTHDDWRSMWMRASRIDYIPQIRVSRIKPREPSEHDPTGMIKAVLEVAKYPVKPEAYGAITTVPDQETDDERELRLDRVRCLRTGIARKRLISYFGLLKQLHAELQLDDAEDGDLVHTDQEVDVEDPDDPWVDRIICPYDRTVREYIRYTERDYLDSID